MITVHSFLPDYQITTKNQTLQSKAIDMTLEDYNFLIATDDPLMPKDLTWEQVQALLAQQEQVRLRYAQLSLQSPLYQARAAKDPQFLSNYSAGAVR